jgi:uncharacterized phage protein gp47/JayE
MRFDMGTQEDIIQRINGRLTIPANLLEGGFSQDIIGSVAYEIANIEDTEINGLIEKSFVTTAPTMEDLTRVAADYGFEPRTKTNAIVYLEITGNNGATVNNTVKAVYENLIFTVQEYGVIGSSGKITVKAKCETAGSIGNVPANTITEFLTVYEELTAVNNPNAAYDGFDDEDLETFRARLLAYLKEDAANCNKAQYKQWALEVAGVKTAVVQGAEDVGAGNVAVYIASNTGAVSQELINTVKDYIEERQFINANLIVQSLNYLDVDTEATIVLKAGYTVADVKEEYGTALAEYLENAKNIVSYFKASDLLFACAGVQDVTDFSLNGGTDSIEIEETDYPVVGGIEIDT